MLRIRLRHFLVLVLYVGVVVLLSLAVRDRLDSRHPADALKVLLCSPFLLGLFSVVVLRPGPHRDWVLAFFYTLTYTFMLLLCLCLPLAYILTGVSMSKPIGGTWREPITLALSLFAGVFVLSCAMFVGKSFLVPQRCPRCCRKALLRSAVPLFGRIVPRFWHLRCGTCDCDALLNIHRLLQPCPSCGRETLYVKRYKSYWCLRCHARSKRLRRGDWEYAGLPEEDSYYLLWSLDGWIRTVYKRLA